MKKILYKALIVTNYKGYAPVVADSPENAKKWLEDNKWWHSELPGPDSITITDVKPVTSPADFPYWGSEDKPYGDADDLITMAAAFFLSDQEFVSENDMRRAYKSFAAKYKEAAGKGNLYDLWDYERKNNANT